jgi:putative hydrolase of the HAD superfamily
VIDPELLRDVDLLCLDAGNTVVFLDHARVARLVTELGHPVAADAIVRGEGVAKIGQQEGGLVEVAWSGRDRAGAKSWGRVVATIVAHAGVPANELESVLETLWREHAKRNLYSLVPDGLEAALDEARRAGVRVGVVSNSEGTLEALFVELGIRGCFDFVVDSAVVGVEKPDPRIFAIALERANATAARALMLGDTYATDISGARAAGIRAALIDPHGHLDGRHPDVPRVPGVVEVARALARS